MKRGYLHRGTAPVDQSRKIEEREPGAATNVWRERKRGREIKEARKEKKNKNYGEGKAAAAAAAIARRMEERGRRKRRGWSDGAMELLWSSMDFRVPELQTKGAQFDGVCLATNFEWKSESEQ